MAFSSSFPAWLCKPETLKNVFNNPFIPLKEVPSAISFSDNASFMSGLRQALYWRRQLSASLTNNTVIFSFLGVRGLSLPNVLEVCKALKNICNMSTLQEVYRAPNSPFIGISFSDTAQITKFQTLCTSFDSFLVVHVHASSSLTRHFKLLGLPPLFQDSRIHHFLDKHFAQHQFKRDLIATDDNILTPANSVSGTVLLHNSKDSSTIPHLIPLPAPHLGSALLILSGRQSLCLKCGSLGHTRRFCSSPRCTLCHHFHPSTAPCLSTSLASDPSISHYWSPLDSSTPSTSAHPTSSSIFVSAMTECNRTRHVSAPAELSSPVLSSSSNTHFSSEPVPTDRNNASATSDKRSSAFSSTHLDSAHAFTTASYQHKHLSSNHIASNSKSTTALIPSSTVSTKNMYSLLKDNVSEDMDNSSTNNVDKGMPVFSFTAPHIPALRSSSLHSASKRAKFFPSVLASPLAPTSSWADQAEMELEQGADTSPSFIPSDLSTSSESLSAPALSVTDNNSLEDHAILVPSSSDHTTTFPSPSSSTSSASAKNHIYSLESLQPHPSATSPMFHFKCYNCKFQSSLSWPLDKIHACTKCYHALSINTNGFFIPSPSLKSIYLMLPQSYFEVPANISYLDLCLYHKVRLKTPTSTNQ